MKTKLLLTCLLVPALASAQPYDKPQQPPSPGKTVDGNEAKAPDDKPAKDTDKRAKLSNDEVMILAHLHHVNVMEIGMGKQAKKKGTAAVKRYADMLVKDHQKSDKEVTAFAKKKGVAKIPAAKPQTEAERMEQKQQKQQMAALAKLKGADFDREYLRMMVEGHEKEIAKTDTFLASATDPDLDAMLEARKTTLRKHADAAKELQQGGAQASVNPKPAK